MTTLFIYESKKTLQDPVEIAQYLNKAGVLYERWLTPHKLSDSSTSEEIFEAYAAHLKPFMQKHGYVHADVVNVHAQTPNIEVIRQKFLAEHTHSEDEIRFFVEGAGLFYFHFPHLPVFSLKCIAGDFISVPKGVRHWFDLAPEYRVKAIRIFQDPAGWVAQYTASQIEQKYLHQDGSASVYEQ
jgi:1,2-dihydroxy-3-keto-5-methylthiopentene dioxygenase